MSQKKQSIWKKYQTVLGIALGVTALQVNQAEALTVLNDTTFTPYQSTGLNATTDDYEILTTAGFTGNHIISGNLGLSAGGGKILTVNSANSFKINLTGAGNFNSSSGIRTMQGTVIANSDIDITLIDGRGIYLANGGTGIFDKKVTIVGTGTGLNSFIGIMGYSTSATGGKGTFKDDVSVFSSGQNSFGVVIQNGDPTGDTPILTFDKKATIHMTGTNSWGINTQDIAPGGTTVPSLIHFKDGLDLDASGAGSVGIQTELANSLVKVDGISIIKGDDAAVATYSGKLEVNGTTTIVGGINVHDVAGGVDINAKANIAGNITALDGGIANLNLQAGSMILGEMNNYTTTALPAGYASAGNINMNFGSVGSQWQLTGTSYINTLSGTGHFLMTTDIAANTATVLYVTDAGGATGAHTVAVADTGSGSVASVFEQLLVSTNGGGAIFTMPILANIGAFQYDIKQAADNPSQWVLYRSAGSSITPTAKAVFNDVRAGYLMNFSETQTLLQRMGELRDEQGHNRNGVWGRMFFGEFDVNGNGLLDGFHQTFKGVQIGADRRFDLKNKDRVYVGGTFGYTNGDQSYEAGSGDIDSYYVGVYGAYIKDNGFYVDNLLKFGWQDQSFHLRDNLGNLVKSDSDTKSISWSTEVGYRYYMDREQKEGWYVEPQAQLTLGHVSGDTFRISNGMNVKFESYDMALGRVGLLAGYTIKKDNNPINVYAKASYVHEFSGNLESRMNGDWIKTDLGSSWWTYGVGVNAKIGKRHNVYMDVERSTGGDFQQLWRLNGGYRFNW